MATRDLVTAIIVTLATTRLIQLTMFDTVTEPIRRWVYSRFGPGSKTVELLGCPWCCGWWISVALVGFAWTTGLVSNLPTALIMIPACSYVAVAIGATIEKE
jgi:hypothetical protein